MSLGFVQLALQWVSKKSVDVAQATTTYLAKSACCEDVVYSVIIDNVIFCSSYRSLQATCMRFQSICDAFNVTIGESTGICTQVTFRGICLDFRQRVITLAQKFRFKLLLKFFLYKNASSNTWGEVRSLIGSFVYVATARGTPLTQIYALLKCAARNVLTHPSGKFSWSQCEYEEALRIIEIVVENEARPALFRPSGIWIISDASNVGWGTICVNRGIVSEIHGSWDQQQRALHINVKEAIALANGLRN